MSSTDLHTLYQERARAYMRHLVATNKPWAHGHVADRTAAFRRCWEASQQMACAELGLTWLVDTARLHDDQAYDLCDEGKPRAA